VKPVASWFKAFTRDEHAAMKDLLGNLLPLSKQMNQSLGNGPYTKKRSAYMADSGFKATREFAKQYRDWTPAQLKARSRDLADWAARRWRD
jgi:hypothetical protein